MNKFQVLFLLALFAVTIANLGTSYTYGKKIEEKNIKITAISEEVKEKINKTEIKKEEIEEIEIGYISPDSCTACHEKSYLYLFHNTEGIVDISGAKNIRPRLCGYCHGERVMVVHFEGMKEKRIKCEACHVRGSSGFLVPEKKEGVLFVCELCHAGGNYIKIHVDGNILENAEMDEKWIRKREPKNCTLCHNEEVYGANMTELHKIKASEVGRLEKLPSIPKDTSKEKIEKNITADIEKIWSKISSGSSIVRLP